MSEGEKGEPKLNPQGVNLRALLAAYDKRQEGMSEEEKKAQNERVATGQEQVAIPHDEASEYRAAVRVSQLEGTTVEKGKEDIDTLKEAAKALNAPGIENLISYLGRDETKESK